MNRYARGGLSDYKRDYNEKARADYSDEMDHRDRWLLDNYNNIVGMKQPLGDMAPPRLPKVRYFEEGGGTSTWDGPSADPADMAGPEYAASSSPSYNSSNYNAPSPSSGVRDSNIADAGGVYGGNVASGPSAYGGSNYDPFADGYTYGGGSTYGGSGNSGIGVGAEDGGGGATAYYDYADPYNYGMYTPALAPAPAPAPTPSYELPGPMPDMPEPGYTGVGAEILTANGIGPAPAYNASQPLGGLGVDLFSPTPIANQDVDLANPVVDSQSFNPALTGPTSQFNNPFSTNLTDIAASSNLSRLGSPDEYEDAPDRGFHGTRSVNAPAVDPFASFTPDTFVDRGFQVQPQNNVFETWSPEIPEDTGGSFGVRNNERATGYGPTMSKAQAREQFTYEYTRDQLKKAGYNPTPEFMAAVTGNFRKEAPNLLSGKTPDEINHIGAQGLMQTLGTRQDRLQEFRAQQDPNFGNLRKDLDFFVDNVRSPVIGDDFNTRKDYSRFVDAIDSPNIDDGIRAMNAYERPGGYAGYNTPLNNLDQGRAMGTYARDYDRRFGDLTEPSVATSIPGQPRAELDIPELDPFATERSIVNELFGVGSAQAASAAPAPAPSGGGSFLGDIGRAISSGIRSITGTTDDGTQPGSGARPPATPTSLFDLPVGGSMRLDAYQPTPDDIRTLSREALSAAGAFTGDNSVSRRGVEVADLPGIEDTGVGSGGRPAPVSTGTQYADVPMPTERPWTDYTPPEVAGAQPTRTASAAAATPAATSSGIPDTNRYNVDPLTGNTYDNVTGNRVFNPGGVSKAIDLGLGFTPAGVVNTPLALLGGLFDIPLSGGQIMATGRPGTPGANAGSGDAPDAYGNYGSYGEGAAGRDPPGVQSAAGDPYAGPVTPAPVQGGSTSTTPSGQTVISDRALRNYLGVDDPRTYGFRPQQRMYSARGGLARLKGRTC